MSKTASMHWVVTLAVGTDGKPIERLLCATCNLGIGCAKSYVARTPQLLSIAMAAHDRFCSRRSTWEPLEAEIKEA